MENKFLLLQHPELTKTRLLLFAGCGSASVLLPQDHLLWSTKGGGSQNESEQGPAACETVETALQEDC